MIKIKKVLRILASVALSGTLAFLIITAVDIYRFPDQRGLQNAHFVSIDGQRIDLSQTDKPVMLYFWGSWCPFCRHTSPQVESLRRAGYPIVSIATTSGDDQAVRTYLREHGWDFPVINDPDGELWAAFDIAAAPTIAFVENGKILLSTSGWSSAWGLRLRYRLLALLPS